MKPFECICYQIIGWFWSNIWNKRGIFWEWVFFNGRVSLKMVRDKWIIFNFLQWNLYLSFSRFLSISDARWTFEKNERSLILWTSFSYPERAWTSQNYREFRITDLTILDNFTVDFPQFISYNLLIMSFFNIFRIIGFYNW